MIGYLEGIIKHKGTDHLVLLISGIGYKVFTPVAMLAKKNLGEKTNLYIYTYVKDDALNLYGFSSRENLVLFELLINVSGIGPKIAVAIFSKGNSTDIKQAIIKGDIDFFTGVPRLGRKNAQKIIIELRSKLGKLEDLDLTDQSEENKEIIEVLKSFGFKSKEAKDALKAVKDIKGETSEKIKQALKYLGKK